MLWLVSMGAAAEIINGTCGKEGDNVKWCLDTEKGTLVISGVGEMEDYFYHVEGHNPVDRWNG